MILIYGANGYTGELCVAEARRRGLDVVTAGRSKGERIFPVDAPDLSGATVLLNCAGPFSRTAGPLVDACLRAGVHYADITGEIGVFEALAARDAEAKAAGIVLLPGAGFDVVPSDCLAAHVARRLPGAARLEIAICGSGGLSHGTMTTMLEGMDHLGGARVDGRLVPLAPLAKRRTVDFGGGVVRDVASLPWGDVATAWRSTGIPDITCYAVFPKGARIAAPLAPLLKVGWIQRFLARRIPAGGPSPEARAKGWSRVWAEATHPDGRRATARLLTPEGYALTALAAVDIASRLAGVPPGYHTPATAFGPDYVLTLPGVTREDVPG